MNLTFKYVLLSELHWIDVVQGSGEALIQSFAVLSVYSNQFLKLLLLLKKLRISQEFIPVWE